MNPKIDDRTFEEDAEEIMLTDLDSAALQEAKNIVSDLGGKIITSEDQLHKSVSGDLKQVYIQNFASIQKQIDICSAKLADSSLDPEDKAYYRKRIETLENQRNACGMDHCNRIEKEAKNSREQTGKIVATACRIIGGAVVIIGGFACSNPKLIRKAAAFLS